MPSAVRVVDRIQDQADFAGSLTDGLALVYSSGTGKFSLSALPASIITSGTIAAARLGTGTADNTTFLRGDGTWQVVSVPVSSIFGRTGAVVAESGDYTVAQVTGAAPLASPTFTGVPAAPTATPGTNTTQLATTAFTRAEIAALVASAPGTLDTLNELALALGSDPNFATTVTNSLALKAPLASPTFTGTPAAPTAVVGTNTTQVATTAYVLANVANPSGLIGMAAVNGVATTSPRSDSTHAIDPAIGPTWTGQHVWRVASNQNAFFGTSVAVAGGVALNATNDANSANIPLELRGTTLRLTGMELTFGSGSSNTVIVTTTRMGINLGGSPAGTFELNCFNATDTGVIVVGQTGQSAVLVSLRGKSSTSTIRSQADIDTAWIDSTDATRKARTVRRAWDTAARETDRGWADGSVGRFAAACPASAPTDAHVGSSQVTFWIDESGNNLTFLVKYADGTTLKSGTVALT